MARFGIDQSEAGRLDVCATDREGRIEAFFVPNESPHSADTRSNFIKRVKLIEFDRTRGVLRIHPINTLRNNDRYLDPKYNQVRVLTLEMPWLNTYGDEVDMMEVLEALPSGFVKDYNYGLGLLKDCNRIIHLIEKHSPCTEVCFCDEDGISVVGTEFRIGINCFFEIWGEIERINRRGSRATRRVKDTYVHNRLADALKIESTEYSLGRHPHSGIIAKAASGDEELSDDDRRKLVNAMRSESATLAANDPQRFKFLHREIELVSLERLIREYEESLNENQPETYWQTFLEDNSLALQQVFGAPMIRIQSESNVGGSGFSREGGKIADFLFKNSLTNNMALVEIKKPGTRLLEGCAYRQGLFAPSKEINAAVSQVLDQAYNLSKNIGSLKDSSRRWDLESYAISCYVVAGRTPPADEPDKQKSFELYRANSKAVKIVTYDEILEQLKQLHESLVSDNYTD